MQRQAENLSCRALRFGEVRGLARVGVSGLEVNRNGIVHLGRNASLAKPSEETVSILGSHDEQVVDVGPSFTFVR